MSLGEAIFQTLVYVLAIIIPLGALIAGGRAERIAAVIFVVATIASKTVEELSLAKHAGVIFLGIDGAMAVGFLVLALLYRHLWISLMMLTMAGFFSIHAFYEMTSRDLDPSFAMASNLATTVLLASLAIGTWTARGRRDEAD